jgi:hypothetical protein
MERNNLTKGSRGLPLGPAVLIILGTIFLLNNFGVLQWDLWTNIWKFWPVILILIGIEVLAGKRASFRTFLILAIVIFLIPLLLIFSPLGQNPLINSSFGFEKPLGNLTSAKILVELPASNVKLSALELGSLLAVKGTIKYSQIFPKPEVKSEENLNQGYFTLNQGKNPSLPFLSGFASDSEFKISRLIPVEVVIKTTAGKNNLDFTQLRLNSLRIETGATQTKITFSKNYSAKVYIHSSAGFVTLKIPKEIAAQIKASDMKNLSLDKNRFQTNGNLFKSKDFELATTKLTIEISSGATRISVE